MRKDLKIGMLLGVVTVAVAALWLATRPALSTKARLLQTDFSAPPQTQNPPAPYSPQTQQEFLPRERPLAESAADTQPKSVAPALSAPQLSRAPEPNAGPVVKIHIVEKGQTLSDIAYKYYGSANKWQKIFEANRSRLKDANILIPGTKLTIPD
jgi:nucleoid-associated protein YgaU